jgi:catecholate siderophore receptor
VISGQPSFFLNPVRLPKGRILLGGHLGTPFLSRRAFRAQQKVPQRRHWQLLPPRCSGNQFAVSSDKALLPLGALMLAVSVSGWAQSVTPVPAASGTAATTQSEGKSLAPVTVTGTRDRENQTYQSGITSVGKMPVPAKDIPQSLTVVNEKLMHDQGKDSFKSALENVIGITFEAGEGGRVGDNIRLRGFSAAGDIYTDGMRDIAQYNRDNFNTERVEVLRGAASMLFGRGSTGGIINQVSKQPRLITEHEVNATVGTKGYQRYQGDFNFKLDDDCGLPHQCHGHRWRRPGRKRQRIHPPPRPGHGLPLRHRHGQRI